jgi:hypothetical protein
MAKKTHGRPTAPPPPAARNGKNASKPSASAPPARARQSVEKKPNGVPVTPARAATHEEISRAAYLRWERFGGDPESNWLAAERELRVTQR